jgi:CRP-like cAMP-binding protein
VAGGHAHGQAEHLRTMGPGTYFGEIGLLERIPRTATITTATECRAYRIDGDEFLDALAAAPPATTLLEVAGGRLARTHPSRKLTYAAASSEAAPAR